MRHARLLAASAAVLVIASLAIGPVPTDAATGLARPDIVVIMLDDMAPEPRLLERLPNIDKFFLDRGLTFTNYVGNDPLCCPGRANFLTGLYVHHHGVTLNDARMLDPRMTFAPRLQQAGYWTAYTGKYLNAASGLADKTPLGWDRVVISGGRYYDYALYRNGVLQYRGGAPTDYSTDVFAGIALKAARKAPPDRPMFMMVAPFAIHGAGRDAGHLPTPAPRHVGDARCADIGSRLTPAFNEADMSDKPPAAQLRPLISGMPDGWPLQPACEALLSVDELFRDLLAVLRPRGRLDNTLFILTADNGMDWGDHRWIGKGLSSATPMPLYMRWDAMLGRRRRVIPEHVSNVDMAPTFAAIAGTSMAPYPDGRPSPDGMSLLPLLDGSGQDGLERDALLEEHTSPPEGHWRAIRTTTQYGHLWHYTEWSNGDRELYDLEADPWELENLAGAAPYAIVEIGLAHRLAELWEAGD